MERKAAGLRVEAEVARARIPVPRLADAPGIHHPPRPALHGRRYARLERPAEDAVECFLVDDRDVGMAEEAQFRFEAGEVLRGGGRVEDVFADRMPRASMDQRSV